MKDNKSVMAYIVSRIKMMMGQGQLATGQYDRELFEHKEYERMEGVAKAFYTLANSFSKFSENLFAPVEEKAEDSWEYTPEKFQTVCTPLDKMNLLLAQKNDENRYMIARQLTEMADILSHTAKDTYGIEELTQTLENRLYRALKAMNVKVAGVRVIRRAGQGMEVYANICAKKNNCILTKEIARGLSTVCKCHLVPGRESKMVIYRNYVKVNFVEDVNYNILYGACKRIKTGEKVSGDNFSIIENTNGKAVMALSDGMGSGVMACRESEMVLDLLEQFLEAGFEKETAVRMINSCMCFGQESQMYSTMDISEINLNTGQCEFLKAGASYSFIKRENKVEPISCATLPPGLFSKLEFDSVGEKLYDGDYVIMISDGVMDAIIDEHPEQILADMILRMPKQNPAKMAEYVIKEIEQDYGCYFQDDVTVLVCGIWNKR